MLKFAANLSMLFTELPFLQRFAAAAEAGFRAVEFLFPYDYPAEEIKRQLDAHQLQLVLFNTPPGDTAAGEWGVAALPGREAEARRDIDQALAYARALECPSLHVMAGVVTPALNAEQCRETFLANVGYAADRAAELGVNIMLEALSPQVRPNYLFSSQWQTLALCDAVQRPNVYVQLDLFHAQLVDGNLTNLITTLNARIGHVQIASVPDRHEPDRGETDYPWLFNALREVNYRGYIAAEYHPANGTLPGLGWVKPWL
ncbi:2-dehydrotetronate isomerase [Paramixta manurensis]|uniref:2-dehydrotetronate isomerase n=1 Tax=Paramixta manurensis TaxID=2740817 RepID=A0A6M8U4C4_9GAMM|nr:2-dehydrotetronate isomerase [Erwiniaceae bacterium PD-1]